MAAQTTGKRIIIIKLFSIDIVLTSTGTYDRSRWLKDPTDDILNYLCDYTGLMTLDDIT